MGTVMYKADANTIAALEGCTSQNAYLQIAAVKKKLRKPSFYVLSVYEFCKAQGIDYDKVMLDLKEGKLRKQTITAREIALLLNVTERTGYNYLVKLRDLHKYNDNTCVHIRDFADFSGIDVETIHDCLRSPSKKKLFVNT